MRSCAPPIESLRRTAPVGGSAKQLEERTLAHVDEVASIRGPERAEVRGGLGGDARAAATLQVHHPHVRGTPGRSDVDDDVARIGGVDRVGIAVGIAQHYPLTALPVDFDDDELRSRHRRGDDRDRARRRDIVGGEAVGQVHRDIVDHGDRRSGDLEPPEIERHGEYRLVPREEEVPARGVPSHHAAADQHLPLARLQVEDLDRRSRDRRAKRREDHVAAVGQQLWPPVGKLLRRRIRHGEPPCLATRGAHPPQAGLVALGVDDGAVRSPGAASPARFRERDGRATLDRQLDELAVHREGDPAAVGGEKRPRRALAAGNDPRAEGVEPPCEEHVAPSRHDGDDHGPSVGRQQDRHRCRPGTGPDRARRRSVRARSARRPPRPRRASQSEVTASAAASIQGSTVTRRPRRTGAGRLGAAGARRDSRAERGIPERGREVRRAGEPVGRQLLQGGMHRLGDVAGDGLPQRRDLGRLGGHHLGDDRLRRRPAEGRLAGEHLVEHAAQRVDVAARVELALAHRLLGAHVLRRAERHPGLGHPGAGLAGGERDAEVGDERAAVVEQDVLRLDVAVDDAVPMGVVERARDLGGDPDGLADRQLLLAGHPVAERDALDERHHVEEEASRPLPNRTAAGCAGAAGSPWS